MIIGICGGTGSGKTTIANRILQSVSADEVVFIQQDLYYRNLKDMPLDYRNAANFDHPDALEFRSLITAFGHLPDRGETQPHVLAERQRDKEQHKQRLAALYARSPDVAQKFADQIDMEILASSPEEFASFQKSEQERWFKVIKEYDIKSD